MKAALLKKRSGVPAALLIVLLLAGTALAWCGFASVSSDTTVKEPLSPANEVEFSDHMYPGETNVWTFDIVNAANRPYTIKADLTFSEPGGVSITDFTVTYADGCQANETRDLLDGNSVKLSILASETISCRMTISAAEDATSGTVSVRLDLSRRQGGEIEHY